MQRLSARHQRFRRDERGVPDVLHGAVSGAHHDPGGRAAGRHRGRDRVHREEGEGSIVDALELDTPALYVDLDALERNIARMQQQCPAWGGGLRRLRALAKTRRVKVAVDSVAVARDLQGIDTLVEVDVGVGRTGAQSPEQAVEIARAFSDWRGIFYWPSWLDETGFQAACVKIDAVLDALAAAGFEAKIVSGGSTPGAAKTPLIPRTTEIRPGTYVFYDASSLAAKLCDEADCALRVLTTVVSTTVPGQCVIDAGSKTFSSDQTVGVG